MSGGWYGPLHNLQVANSTNRAISPSLLQWLPRVPLRGSQEPPFLQWSISGAGQCGPPRFNLRGVGAVENTKIGFLVSVRCNRYHGNQSFPEGIFHLIHTRHTLYSLHLTCPPSMDETLDNILSSKRTSSGKLAPRKSLSGIMQGLLMLCCAPTVR